MNRREHFATLALLGFRFLVPPEEYTMRMGDLTAIGPRPVEGSRAYRIARIDDGARWAKTIYSYIEEDQGWIEVSGYACGGPRMSQEMMEWLQNQPMPPWAMSNGWPL